ncbi:DNA repair protein UVH3 isoform X2 [Silene latifolia]|uniref:DNA repair protein UVH3 isoform X2 n=1 Tax=Silene latifolia TaxID=37657 RepID=UPI003D778A35
MGVHGLWDLLAPVGRRVSVETLSGKRLAIDASIWMVQFMKAMRDEKGEMVRNAHLLGFFRRICKLLFLRTKPVFVFDGGTPALKRRTVIARRRQRENAQAKIRKTAEKLFLNQVKAMRLSNMAENLKDQIGARNSKGKEVMKEQSDTVEKNDAGSGAKNQEMLDEMLAASIVAEECGGLNSTASICASPHGNASAFTYTSTSEFTVEDEESADDEEMIMPITDGNVDPSVLAALPPSMQLDLLVQMREKLMAENRQKYQKVKKAPQKFSELQIEAYLKTVAFRREIDEVQKAAAGRGVGGVQTSRIASEANREFIFSSSFSGDKQVLASSGAQNFSHISDKKEPSSDAVDVISASGSKRNAEPGSACAEVETYVDERGRKRIHTRRAMGIRMTRDLQRNIEMMKESENEKTTANNGIIEVTELESAVGSSGKSVSEGRSIEMLNCDHHSPQKSLLETAALDSLKNESSIKISFNDDGRPVSIDDDDSIFTRLVAGSPLSLHSDDNSASDVEWEDVSSVKRSNILSDRDNPETIFFHAEDTNKNESDLEWEMGPNTTNRILEANTSCGDNADDNDIRAESQKTISENCEEEQQFSANLSKAVSKGSAEEEFALQEAIKRSLGDITCEMTSSVFPSSGKSRSNMLKLGSDDPQLISQVGEVFTGIDQPQPLIIENDQMSVLAVMDASASCTSFKHSDSAVDDVSRAVSSISEGNKNLHFHQSKTSAENAEIGNLGDNGTGVPTVTAFGSLCNSRSVLVADDLANEEVTVSTSELPIGHGTPGSGLQTSHADTQRKVAEDDMGFVSLLETSHDAQLTAPHEEDISNELFSASLEDELLVLGKEYKDLENEQKKLERNAESVNNEMFVECQELLQMFGLPYIIAPMEAEAQCAFLELANLVDGVVTDDSDVFLFGARCVFKNIFDDRKYVETYLLKDIESELGLNTEKLIRMALLLGSDYTEGVSGIGIVNAIEVVNAFPDDDGFHKFREWVDSPDPTILGKGGLQTGLSSKKNGLKVPTTADCSTSDANEANEDADSRKRQQIFMNKHRNISKNWHFPASFPSEAVISAYKSPQVDNSAEPFSWGKPDIFSLRRLCSEKFAWANQKADELLLPVLKEYNKHETQLRLEAFYSFNEKFANIRSKRIRQAVKGITGKRSLADTDDLHELSKEVNKRGENSGNRSNTKKKDGVGEIKNPSKGSKSKKRDVKVAEKLQLIDKAEEKRVDGSACGKARGGNSGKGVKRGRRMESSDSDLDDITICSLVGSSDEHEHVLQSENDPLPHSVRRSKRARKATNYVDKDDESDTPTKSPTSTSQKHRNDERGPKIPFEFEDVHEIDMTKDRRQQEVTRDDDVLSGDYLLKGGGFCADENVELTNKQEISIQSKGAGAAGAAAAADDDDSECLQMGGGFCANDAEHLESQDLNPSEGHKSTHVSPSNMAKNGDDDTRAPVNAFSAIPFLRRKKRKT